MAEHSAIGWTDATWPIVAGCDYESPGCSNCWAVRDSWRLAHNPHPAVREAFAGTVRKTDDGKLVWTGTVRQLRDRLDWPLKWKTPRRIFVCSQSDLFHPSVPDDFILSVFDVMRQCENGFASGLKRHVASHTFQVLTKHAARMRNFCTRLRFAQNDGRGLYLAKDLPHNGFNPMTALKHVWMGVTVEDQRRAEERIPNLLRTPAALHWLSVEPMLERIDLTDIREPSEHVERGVHHDLADIGWVVCGGESAQTRATTREFDIEWARDLRDQCAAASVPFFMKQLGSRPIEGIVEIYPRPAGKSTRYKWHEPEHWPEDLRRQEFPA